MARNKKDPEAPYSGNPTPGKPGWNIAKGKKQQPSHVGLFDKLKARKEATDKATKSSESIWKQGKGGA